MVYIPPAQEARQTNPFLNNYLNTDATSIKDEQQRHMYQVEGYMRYRRGQISYEEMTARGTNLMPLALASGLPMGTVLELDKENNTVKHHQQPLVMANGQPFKGNFIGKKDPRYSGRGGKVISVANRRAIDPTAKYMWKLDPSHRVIDICDDYHGRVYLGKDLPMPLHFGCNCKAVKLDSEERIDSRGKDKSPLLMGSTAYTAVASTGVLQQENTIRRDAVRFVDGINSVNSKLELGVEILDFALNPVGYVFGEISSRVLLTVTDKVAMAVASKIDDPITAQLAQGYVKGNVSEEAFSVARKRSPNSMKYVDSLIKLRRLTPTVVSLARGNVLEIAVDLFDIYDDIMDVATKTGVDKKLKIDTDLLNQKRAKAVLLEDGVRGLKKTFMILF